MEVRRQCPVITERSNAVSQTVEQHEERCAHGHLRHHKGAEHHREPHDVTITCNGIDKAFHFRSDELGRALLNRAIQEFRIVNNPHTYGLYNSAGSELNDNDTLEAAGVECGDTLLLRPSTVRAGLC